MSTCQYPRPISKPLPSLYSTYLAKDLEPGAIALGYLFSLPDRVFLILPAAVLFATVFSIGNMARHFELVASKASGRSASDIAAQAVERAIADAGLQPEDIDGLMTSPGVGDQFDEAAFHAHFGTSHPMWVSPKGGGMVWSATAPY